MCVAIGNICCFWEYVLPLGTCGAFGNMCCFWEHVLPLGTCVSCDRNDSYHNVTINVTITFTTCCIMIDLPWTFHVCVIYKKRIAIKWKCDNHRQKHTQIYSVGGVCLFLYISVITHHLCIHVYTDLVRTLHCHDCTVITIHVFCVGIKTSLKHWMVITVQ